MSTEQRTAATTVEPAVPNEPSLIGARARRIELREAMADLEVAAARATASPDWVARVEVALLGLSAAVDAHAVEVEAESGILADVLEKAPRLEYQVGTMRSDHDELRESCQNLLARLHQEPAPDAKVIRRKVISLLGRLTLHRQQGSELVFDAYNVDIGSGD
ncbi:MAG: hypothetical protein DWQ40_02820 [Actinobacteria bacterium]|nr:MAG: hypothetical protein DWQ40_02820 [Actinomycetota bacterium]